jgi:hypothetical protein
MPAFALDERPQQVGIVHDIDHEILGAIAQGGSMKVRTILDHERILSA